MPHTSMFDPDCRRCPRLAAHLDEIKRANGDYHCRPVAAFGDPGARLLIVGLAPGKHGANATGRPFTGDYAGVWLYETLYRYGFSSQPCSEGQGDGLRLLDCRITNAVKCLPPDNKPTNQEIRVCNGFLAGELAAQSAGSVVLALGRIAHDAVLRAVGEKLAHYPFAHAKPHRLSNHLSLLDSYHCSRYNTQTGRLSRADFHTVFDTAVGLLAASATERSAS